MHINLINIISETLKISLIVLIMMVIVDLINLWSHGKIAQLLKSEKRWRQYIVSSAIGTLPGCVGGFTNVSLYIHGMISFGALVGSMAAASGDEAFVMLALFPKTALLLFGVLFLFGIITGWLTDIIIKKANISTCEDCPVALIHHNEKGLAHYIKEHIYNHIIKKHLWKTALWTSGALLVIEFGMQYLNLEAISSNYTILLLFAAALIGLVPESGPHLIFVSMFANELIPFSVLFTSSVVQDGHSMLPMLSYSIKDSMLLKIINILLGISVGFVLYLIGL